MQIGNSFKIHFICKIAPNLNKLYRNLKNSYIRLRKPIIRNTYFIMRGMISNFSILLIMFHLKLLCNSMKLILAKKSESFILILPDISSNFLKKKKKNNSKLKNSIFSLIVNLDFIGLAIILLILNLNFFQEIALNISILSENSSVGAFSMNLFL